MTSWLCCLASSQKQGATQKKFVDVMWELKKDGKPPEISGKIKISENVWNIIERMKTWTWLNKSVCIQTIATYQICSDVGNH